MDFAADAFQLFEEQAKRHPIAEGTRRSVLNDGAVGHRVGKGDAHLHHVDAARLERTEDTGCVVQRRKTGRKVNGKDSVGFRLE